MKMSGVGILFVLFFCSMQADNEHALRLSEATVIGSKFNESMADTIQDFYEQISAIPIYELLDLIDEIVNQFDDISTSYEFNNPEVSWSAWLNKYWWMPPMMVIAALIMAARYQKTAQNVTGA